MTLIVPEIFHLVVGISVSVQPLFLRFKVNSDYNSLKKFKKNVLHDSQTSLSSLFLGSHMEI